MKDETIRQVDELLTMFAFKVEKKRIDKWIIIFLK